MTGSQDIGAMCDAAAFGEAEWPALLRAIAAEVDGVRGILLGGNGAGSSSHSSVWNHDPDVAAAYNSHWNRMDPRAAPSLAVPAGEVALGQALTPNGAIANSEYFQAISVKGDIADSVFGVITDDLELGRRSISVQRSFAQDFFGGEEARRLRAILPGLERAMRSSLRLARVLAQDRAEDCIMYALLDPGLGLHFPDGREASEEWRWGALAIAGERLACATPELAEAVRHAIATALAGGSVALSAGPVTLRFDPVPEALHWYCEGDAHVFLTVSRNVAARHGEFALFAESFGLTPREAEMLAAIAHAQTLREAASELGIAYETARAHVKNICAKTGHAGMRPLVEAALANDLTNLA